ncbi:arylsulfatase [Cyclobacterium sp.]|uniref:arylsulfatase n=1 Tax=Cyclobacterium sp. TaxID=1966343 RepID=UPI0019B13C32|nr:arylsulfatase [Cyclobacterium sp.]MBD3631052.1 arylsulfatase [Cyclobacterium sp.]
MKIIAIFLLACSLNAWPFSHLLAQKRPNILIIMADDMGYSDMGSFGGEIATPNLDRLAEEGIKFTQFYNAARCCPTRASLLTGLYPHQAGIGGMTNDRGLPAYRGDLSNQCVTIAEVLKNSGYQTFMSGKWHVTKHVDIWRTWLTEDQKIRTSKHNWPLQRGFDTFFGTIHGAGSYYNPATLTKNNTPIDAGEDFYYTDAISEHASELIRKLGKGDRDEKPFFGYIAYTAPHWPLHALTADIEKYKGKYDRGWDKIREERKARMEAMGLIHPEWKLSVRDPNNLSWEETGDKAWWAACMEVYAAMVDRMDQGIGSIIQALEETGQLDNTLIFFLQDNGACHEVLTDNWPRSLHFPAFQRDGSPLLRGNDVTVMPGPESTYMSYSSEWANASNTPFRLYKHYIHEGGISTPLIAYWPEGIQQASRISGQLGHITDIMPTIVEVAGASYPEEYKGEKIKPMEGQSLVPVFRNQTFDHHAIGWEHEGNRGFRDGKWKLVATNRPGAEWELYNIEADRTELQDLAKVQPKITAAMVRKYTEWANRVGVVDWGNR